MADIDQDVQAVVDAAVARALAAQGAPVLTAEEQAASDAAVLALRNQPHPMENQAFTSNPVDPANTAPGTAVTVAVGDNDSDDVIAPTPTGSPVPGTTDVTNPAVVTPAPVSSDPVTGGTV